MNIIKQENKTNAFYTTGLNKFYVLEKKREPLKRKASGKNLKKCTQFGKRRRKDECRTKKKGVKKNDKNLYKNL